MKRERKNGRKGKEINSKEKSGSIENGIKKKNGA